MEGKQGYSITTYRFRLYRKHPEWFVCTKELYSKTADFYLSLILDRELSGLSDYELQRAVEVLSQGEKKKGIAPECPVPYGKLPLYFRRAALREAAAAARSYMARAKREDGDGRAARMPESLDTSPVYYKGMYRNLDLSSHKIELKLFTGTEWKWDTWHFTTDGRELSEDAELLSPTIKIEGKQIFLHFPVKQPVDDVRAVRERAGERYLAVSLQLGEVFAACVAERPDMEENGEKAEEETDCQERTETEEPSERRIRMIRGGKEFSHRRRLLENKLKQAVEDGKKAGLTQTAETERIRRKLKYIIREEAHRVSREIVNFAEEERCRVIAVPDYQGNPGLNKKPYLPSSDYDWIGRRIIEYTAYKSFQKGIVLCRIPVKGISESCSRCGAKIRRYNEGHRPGEGYLGGRLYVCPNGHRGNTAVNTAENVGKRYREAYWGSLQN